ncbi:MAG: NAD(P)/FAD-dependent oxidoreductase [Proteobacteria bacterium]|nr:NAD(P)/FAD-dependent oxidoreductase [Pseudomonadota bacterium]MDA0983350.1 NAD(P)/FAD-dependent oxidoreductase [Pseudomonadota bacterium]
MKRRDFIKLAGAGTALGTLSGLAGCASSVPAKARVVVIGGGFGGATAAKYIRLWAPSIDVVMVERESAYVSCPMSNLVLGGFNSMQELTNSYDGLRQHGVQVVRDEAVAIDAAKKTVRLSRGGDVAYERLVVSPGIDFNFGEIQGYELAMQQGQVLHAWKAGAQTMQLRRQLEGLRDGGVVILSIPLAPYRCPPGPYERACMIAAYLKQAKPRSKLLVLDANADVSSKGGMFKAAWKDHYAGVLEYRGNAKVVAIEGQAVRTEFDTVKGDVLNVVPPHRAGDIAMKAGLITHNNRWCDVDWRSMESKKIRDIHVLGDATLSAPVMPKSGSMANNHAKIAAAAIVGALTGRGVAGSDPKILNTCYSFVSKNEAIRVSSVHEWNAGQGTLLPVKGAGGVSAARSELEANYAWNWARSIWADSLG